MARRLPSQPPTLPGFSHLHVLGAGGFADVFLYEQNMPRRQVAVKVMLSEVVNDHVRQMFQAEANLMAQLSAHPSILTVYQASVSSDGRPYLVMELCSSSLSQRYRAERLPVAEVLRIAVKIGSAVETAHRAGVLHRDIKPSNILLTAYGHPVLSDFGIASTLSGTGIGGEGAVIGMSIPWSAPEVLMDETAGTVESEVWSLAATVYSFLAGRSPFEVPGDSNRSTDLIGRINRAKPQPIGRSDVPASLEAALAKAMSRKPENRHASVLELVRELQAVETELGFVQTQVEVAMDDWALATVADLEDSTRVRAVAGAVPAVSSNKRRRRAAATQAEYSPVGTLLKQSKPTGAPRSTGTSPLERGRGMQLLSWALVGVAAVAIAAAAVVTLALIRADSDDIPVVSDIEAQVDGDDIAFAWQDPGIASDANYQVEINGGSVSVQTSESFLYQADPGDHVCIIVTVNEGGQLGSPSSPKCVDIAG